MNTVLISFLFSIGAATWVYVKMMKNSGGLTKNAITVAAIAGILLFFLFWSVLSLFV